MNLKRFMNNIGAYLVGTLSTNVIQFLFLPLYTIYISATDYGYFDLINTIVLIALPILFQSVWDAVLRFGIEAKDKCDKERLFTTVILYSMVLALFYGLICAILSLILDMQNMQYYFFYAISQMLLLIWSSGARALQYNKAFILGNFVSVLVRIILTIALIVVFDLKLEALFISSIIASVVAIVVIDLKTGISKKINFQSFSYKLLKSLLIYSSPLIVAGTAWQILNLSSRLLIPLKISLEANGIFAISSRFPALISMITSVYTMAWQEEMMHRNNEKHAAEAFNKMFDMLVRLSYGALFIITPLTLIVYPIFIHGDYLDSINYIPILYLSSIYSTFASHMASVFLMKKRTNYSLITTGISALIAILLMLLLSGYISLYGIAIANMLSSVVRFLLCIYLAGRDIKVEVPWKTIFLSTFIYLIFLIVFYSDQILLNIFAAGLGIICGVIYNRRLLRSAYHKISTMYNSNN